MTLSSLHSFSSSYPASYHLGMTIIQDQSSCKADCELLSETLQKIRWRFDRPKRAGPFVTLECNLSGLRHGGTFAPLARGLDDIVGTFGKLMHTMFSWVHGGEIDKTEERRRLEILKGLTTYSKRVCTLAGIKNAPVGTAAKIWQKKTQRAHEKPIDDEKMDVEPILGALDNNKDRDEMDGKLTQRGRDRLLRGEIKCRREEIRSLRDVLDLPLCSYEIPLLARRLIAYSKWLNDKYQLPKDSRTATWTFQQVDTVHYFLSITTKYFDVHIIFNVCSTWFCRLYAMHCVLIGWTCLPPSFIVFVSICVVWRLYVPLLVSVSSAVHSCGSFLIIGLLAISFFVCFGLSVVTSCTVADDP